MLKIKLSECVPFPDANGIYLRTVVAESPEKPGQVIILQSVAMNFLGEKVLVLDRQGMEASVEDVRKGDEVCRQDKMVVAYSRYMGVGVSKINLLKREVKNPQDN